MAKSTGPLLAAGAINVGNATIVHGKPIDWRVPLGIGVVATVFAGLEHVPGLDVFIAGISWIVLVTIVLTRSRKDVPSPAESFASWAGW